MRNCGIGGPPAPGGGGGGPAPGDGDPGPAPGGGGGGGPGIRIPASAGPPDSKCSTDAHEQTSPSNLHLLSSIRHSTAQAVTFVVFLVHIVLITACSDGFEENLHTHWWLRNVQLFLGMPQLRAQAPKSETLFSPWLDRMQVCSPLPKEDDENETNSAE
jgi:hypothetical protein